ncbi:hypothetical protein VNO80_21466 [Phaseolus coccineus]|uniref:Malectin-like domain-containing protein n=1 Tax=Phaseolus coccineus TaxID=3886 RepID=A0AAN9M7Y2_PHACN
MLFSFYMGTLQLHKAAIFFLLFSSLHFPSLGYNVPDKYFINCGSDNNVTESEKVYVGEPNPEASFSSSETERNQSSVPSPLYQTARIFRRVSSYKFTIDLSGTYLLRLHFFPFSSPSNLSSARFNVSVPGFNASVPGFWLENFDGTNDTNDNSALVKEFFMEIRTPTFKITFSPLESSFAFVNAIELFVLPLHLISDKVSFFKPTGGPSSYSGGLLYSRVLETKLRLNVGGQPTKDLLLRNWIPDDIYLMYAENAKNRSPEQGIEYHVDDDSDGPNAARYTAPIEVYGTAKESNLSANATDFGLFNITWALPVDNKTEHFLRLHFCDINRSFNLTYFELSIYDAYVMQVNNDQNVSNVLPAPYYHDFVVNSDDSGHIKVSLTPDGTALNTSAFLNGLEIMKVIESSNDVPRDMEEPSSNHHPLPVVLGSVLGGLVLAFVVVLLGFLWRFKMRKEEPVENSNWLPILVNAGGNSHSRLTDISSHGYINLGLKIPLIDLQLATKKFHANQLIGKGGFGNVYKESSRMA